MLLLILENNYPLDEVVFYDTGMEFEAIYKTRNLVVKMLNKKGIKYTELRPREAFEEKMYNYTHLSRKGVEKQGYGWCGGLCRWGTTEKIRIINEYFKNQEVHQYVGIALDEPKRLERLGNDKSSPLAELGFTEKMALEYCYSRGFEWKEGNIKLYDVLDRVSCWCCRNKNLKELQNYKIYLPSYFEKLQKLEELIGEPMKKPYYLKDRFKESEYIQISIFD